MSIHIKTPIGDTHPHKHLWFKDGTQHVVISSPEQFSCTDDGLYWNVTIHYQHVNDSELIHLALLVDAFRRIYPQLDINLVIPFFPGARQDRVANPGEALSVAVYASIINSMKFARVTILDPHSDVVTALVDNVEVIKSYGFALRVYDELKDTYDIPIVLISPDAGANKKVLGLAKYIKDSRGASLPIVRCDKQRNTETGEITGTEVYDPTNVLPGSLCVIFDDIVSGGRTFTEIGKVLYMRGIAKTILATTHHEGVVTNQSLREGKIDHVYTTNSKNSIIDTTMTTVFDYTDILK